MVEEDAVDGVETVGLAIVAGHPVAIDLGRAVGRSRVERRVLRLRGRRGTEHLRRARLVEARRQLDHADGFEQPCRAEAGRFAGELRLVEAHADVRLRTEVIDLVGCDLRQEGHEPRAVGEVAVVQEQAHVLEVRIAIEVVDPARVEGARPPNQAVDLITLLQQQLCEIGPILTGDAGDESLLDGHGVSPYVLLNV